MTTTNTETKTCANALVLGVAADFISSVIAEIKGDDMSSTIGENSATRDLIADMAINRARLKLNERLRNA